MSQKTPENSLKSDQIYSAASHSHIFPKYSNQFRIILTFHEMASGWTVVTRHMRH